MWSPAHGRTPELYSGPAHSLDVGPWNLGETGVRGGRGGAAYCHHCKPDPQRLTQACVWGGGESCVSVCVCLFACDCARAKHKKEEKRGHVVACVRACLCVCLYVGSGGPCLSGRVISRGRGWRVCKEVCDSQDSCWYLAAEEHQRTEKREETEEDRID